MNKNINSPVSVTAVGFGRNMQPIPKRMEWGGRTYHFIDQGIRIISRRGHSKWNTFTMTDGQQSFCLQHHGGSWVLLSVC